MRAPSQMQSAKDMPSQMTMKVRKIGQGTEEELGERDFRAELEAKERKHFKLDKLEDFESAFLVPPQFQNVLKHACCVTQLSQGRDLFEPWRRGTSVCAARDVCWCCFTRGRGESVWPC